MSGNENKKKRKLCCSHRKELEEARRQLAATREFIVKSFHRLHDACDEEKKEAWNSLPLVWMQDLDVVCAALSSGCCSAQDLPEDLRDNREFLADCVAREAFVWSRLEDDLKDDFAFVRTIDVSKFTGEHVDDIEDMCSRHDDLSRDREFWAKLVSALDCNLTCLFRSDSFPRIMLGDHADQHMQLR